MFPSPTPLLSSPWPCITHVNAIDIVVIIAASPLLSSSLRDRFFIASLIASHATADAINATKSSISRVTNTTLNNNYIIGIAIVTAFMRRTVQTCPEDVHSSCEATRCYLPSAVTRHYCLLPLAIAACHCCLPLPLAATCHCLTLLLVIALLCLPLLLVAAAHRSLMLLVAIAAAACCQLLLLPVAACHRSSVLLGAIHHCLRLLLLLLPLPILDRRRSRASLAPIDGDLPKGHHVHLRILACTLTPRTPRHHGQTDTADTTNNTNNSQTRSATRLVAGSLVGLQPLPLGLHVVQLGVGSLVGLQPWPLGFMPPSRPIGHSSTRSRERRSTLGASPATTSNQSSGG